MTQDMACFSMWVGAASQEGGPVDSAFQFSTPHMSRFLVVSFFAYPFLCIYIVHRIKLLKGTEHVFATETDVL